MIDANAEAFAALLVAAGLPDPRREFVFHPTRRWRFDLAWTEQKIAVEIHGGTMMRGRTGHTSGAGIKKDREKVNEANILGWTVMEGVTNDKGALLEQVLRLWETRYGMPSLPESTLPDAIGE